MIHFAIQPFEATRQTLAVVYLFLLNCYEEEKPGTEHEFSAKDRTDCSVRLSEVKSVVVVVVVVVDVSQRLEKKSRGITTWK